MLIACTVTYTRSGEKSKESAAPVYFKVDPATAGSLTGTVRFSGAKPTRKPVDMSGDPACAQAHHGKAYDESIAVGPGGALANVFIYIKSGLEDKKFESPAEPATIDQRGCWFYPRVLGIQAGQQFRVTNSDPVTHNIHPLAVVNREWNHSQGEGDPPLARKFIKPEVMIRVKCNIHSWMHAFIGVLDHPYFAVTGTDGAYSIKNIPPGNYVIEAWHETLGTQQRNIRVSNSGSIETAFTFKGD
jgi:plastocyanin